MLVPEVLIFISVCMIVCRSDVTLDISLYLITSMNFSPCLETCKATFMSRYFCSFFFWVVHNWWHYNKPSDCQALVGKLFLFIYCIFAQSSKLLLLLPSYPFGSINHFCNQSQKPWINSSKKAMFRSWRLMSLLTLWCTPVIKIWSHHSTSLQVTCIDGRYFV